MDHYEVAVIGGGGAGTMAYLRAVLNFNKAALFLGDADSKRKGRATWVVEVDNIPGMHDLKRPITATTKTTLKWLESQETLKGRGVTIKAAVNKLEKKGDSFLLSFDEKKEKRQISAQFVVLTTGIMDCQPEINGSIDPILPYANRGDAIYCVRCDGHKTIGHKLSVIGDSSIAVHIAALMKERYGHQSVSILTNGETVEYSPTAKQILKDHQFEVISDPITGVLGDPKGEGLKGFTFESGQVETTRTIVALGIIAYNQLLLDLDGKVDDNGRVIVSDKFESSVPGLFAVGDLVSGKKMQIYTAWDEAVDAADEIDRRLRAARR